MTSAVDDQGLQGCIDRVRRAKRMKANARTAEELRQANLEVAHANRALTEVWPGRPLRGNTMQVIDADGADRLRDDAEAACSENGTS